MFNDTIQSADLSEENKGAAEQEDLPCFFKSINHSEKLGWLAVQMRRPLWGVGRCSTWNLAVSVHRNGMRGCCRANADGAEAVRVSASRRWRMKKWANGETWNLFVFCTGTRSETSGLKKLRDVPQGIKKQLHLHLLSRTWWLWSKATGESSDRIVHTEQR